ncbi:MAG TPA: hypothetical protein VHC43_03275 [Mycobacteriales bacterium]|nr:hypothetical protein [Mycobacteriales bacterium]
MTAHPCRLSGLLLAVGLAVAGCSGGSSGSAPRVTPAPTFPASGAGHSSAVAACTNLAESGPPSGGGDAQRTKGYNKALQAARANTAYSRLARDWTAQREAVGLLKSETGADAKTVTAGLNGAVATADAVRRDCGALGVPIPDHSF